jgi:mRNA interferase HigB
MGNRDGARLPVAEFCRHWRSQFTKCKLFLVRVIERLPLLEFGNKWPAAAVPLDAWYRATLNADWRNFGQLKATFGSADQAKVASGQTICIFDIGGNKFRLIAFVSYAKSKVYVLRVLTHKEYDSNRWRKEL